MKNKILLNLLLLLTLNSFAQNNNVFNNLKSKTYLVVGGLVNNSSSLVDIQSTTKGLLTPRMTTAQKNDISTPATGLLVYDTDLSVFNYYNGASWNSFSNIYNIDGTLTGTRTVTQSGYSLIFSGTTSTDYIGFGVTPTAKHHIKGINSLSSDFALKVDNTTENIFGVRNDGMVNSKNGYWINEIKAFGISASLNTFITCGTLPIMTGNRNTFLGGNDSAPPQVGGASNTIVGNFSSVAITGSNNIVLGATQTVPPTSGDLNAIFGRGGMNTPTASSTISFNGFTDASNEVVFGGSVGRYKDWWFGMGKEMNSAQGVFDMNWYSSSAETGETDKNSAVTNWIFNGGQGTGTGIGTDFVFKTAPSGATGTVLNTLVERFRISATGSVIAGNAALATTATDGFLYIPTCAGVPTGVPTTQSGTLPLIIDSTNSKMYFYSGGAWNILN